MCMLMCTLIQLCPRMGELRGQRKRMGVWGKSQSCQDGGMGESLAGQLAVEAGQANGEGLKGTHGVVVVEGEEVLCHSAKLHDDVVRWRGKGERHSSTFM